MLGYWNCVRFWLLLVSVLLSCIIWSNSYRSDFWSSAFFWFCVCVLVICDKDFSILRLDLIHSQNVITVFVLFVHMWYLLKNVTVVFITIYVMFVIVVSRMSVISSWGLMSVRKLDIMFRWCPIMGSDVVSSLRMTSSLLVVFYSSWLRSTNMDCSAWASV